MLVVLMGNACVLRLLRDAEIGRLDRGDDVARKLAMLRDNPNATGATTRALEYLRHLFCTGRAGGCQLAVEALRGHEGAQIVVASCVALSTKLIERTNTY
jgi:hypothetical protein